MQLDLIPIITLNYNDSVNSNPYWFILLHSFIHTSYLKFWTNEYTAI